MTTSLKNLKTKSMKTKHSHRYTLTSLFFYHASNDDDDRLSIEDGNDEKSATSPNPTTTTSKKESVVTAALPSHQPPAVTSSITPQPSPSISSAAPSSAPLALPTSGQGGTPTSATTPSLSPSTATNGTPTSGGGGGSGGVGTTGTPTTPSLAAVNNASRIRRDSNGSGEEKRKDSVAIATTPSKPSPVVVVLGGAPMAVGPATSAINNGSGARYNDKDGIVNTDTVERAVSFIHDIEKIKLAYLQGANALHSHQVIATNSLN
jgi:hypothetical protein